MDLTQAFGLLPSGVEQDIEVIFGVHDWNDEQKEASKPVREALVKAFKAIVQHVPPGPDRSSALRKLREAEWAANSAITHGGRL